MTEHEQTGAWDDVPDLPSYSPFDEPGPTEPESGWHPLNVTHLVMGIAFLGFVAVWGAVTADLVEGDDLRWLLPVPWVLAGLGGLLAIAFGGRRTARA